MLVFCKIPDKKLLKDRNDLFKEVGIPALLSNAFISAPLKTSWNGEYYKSIQGYSYQFARLDHNKFLQLIDVYILKGEPWIQIFLNIFELTPPVESISLLKDKEGLSFGIGANMNTRMRLRMDDYKGPPLFYMFFLPQHKIGRYLTKSGYQAQVVNLKQLIKSDLENINKFVKRWYELHTPNRTDMEGNVIKPSTKQSKK